MTDPIRWGILATGTIAELFTQDLARVPDAEVVAVGSRAPETARRFAERHHIPRAYGSWTELAQDPEVDVVYVATPHTAHYAAAEVCLRHGKPVLCEKPFTINTGEAERLIALAADRGLFLMEAMWMYTNPAVRRVVELIADGAIGEVRSVTADFGLAGPFEPSHRLRDPYLGGGALLDLGVYPVSLTYLLLGMPSTVAATAHLTPELVDANTGVLLGYDSGAVALLSCGIEARSPCVATIVGSQGRITFGPPLFRPDGFTLHRLGQEPERVAVPYQGSGYVHEIHEVGRCLREGRTESPLVTWRSTVERMRILDTIREQVGVKYPTEATPLAG